MRQTDEAQTQWCLCLPIAKLLGRPAITSEKPELDEGPGKADPLLPEDKPTASRDAEVSGCWVVHCKVLIDCHLAMSRGYKGALLSLRPVLSIRLWRICNTCSLSHLPG